MLASARPHVNEVIGGADRVFVVLNHNHRIIQIAQAHQRGEQAIVVALVQADRGLVEHIHHAGQP